MRKYISILMSAIGGILLMYGIDHEKMWYIVGLSCVTGAIKLMMFTSGR